MQKIAYNKFEHKLNKFLKEYLADDSYDHLKERLDLPEKQADIENNCKSIKILQKTASELIG
jgi:hypothetical protein